MLATPLLSDAPIALALTEFRQRFAAPWTLSSLASQVGLSRTALATRFRLALGDPLAKAFKRERGETLGGRRAAPRSTRDVTLVGVAA